jgi:hypothetical protein
MNKVDPALTLHFSALSLVGQGVGGHSLCLYAQLHALPPQRSGRICLWIYLRGSWGTIYRQLVTDSNACMAKPSVFAYSKRLISSQTLTCAHCQTRTKMLRLSDIKNVAMGKWKTEAALESEIAKRQSTVVAHNSQHSAA